MKTTIKLGAIDTPSGSIVRLRIGGEEREAMASDGSFAAETGRLALTKKN